MTYLVVVPSRGKTIVVDGFKYEYVSLEIVGDELGPVHLRLHGRRTLGEDQDEFAYWPDQIIQKDSYVSVTLAQDGQPTAPEKTSEAGTSPEAIRKDLDRLSKALSQFRGSTVPHARKISGALQFQVTSSNCGRLCLRTDKEQYLQVNGVWSGRESVFAFNGRTFGVDKNGHSHSHSFRTWFTDTLRLGEGAKVEVGATE